MGCLIKPLNHYAPTNGGIRQEKRHDEKSTLKNEEKRRGSQNFGSTRKQEKSKEARGQ